MYRSDVTRSKKECNPNASHFYFGKPHLKKKEMAAMSEGRNTRVAFALVRIESKFQKPAGSVTHQETPHSYAPSSR
jgi:hypothetical protein